MLEIHVLPGEIVVNLVGARCTMTFVTAQDLSRLIEKPFWTRIDPSAPISSSEFTTIARLAADEKAAELGWLRP